MKILITGGLGLIGHHLAKHLYDLGHQVSIVDNATDYNIHNEKKCRFGKKYFP